MEIEIQSKSNNPLLNRTEVHFIIHHEGENTPKRELIRGELAEKLNVKKENIMINFMKSSFGTTDTSGYAKVYKSLKEVKAGERDYILKRNNVLVKEKKAVKEEEKKPPVEQSEAKTKEIAKKSAEETTLKSVKEAKEEPTEKPSSEAKPEEQNKEKPDEDKAKEDVEKPEGKEKPAEEKEG
jgi:small subunit ribosomal protein S24e